MSEVQNAINALMENYPAETILSAVYCNLQAATDQADEQGDGSSSYVAAANAKDEALNSLDEAIKLVKEAF